MDTQTHKILDFAEHLWPYISGVVITLLAALRLWWYDRQQTKRDIADFRYMVTHIKDSYATKNELHSCRDDVRNVDEENLERVFSEIKQNFKDNARQHEDIVKQIMLLHTKEKP